MLKETLYKDEIIHLKLYSNEKSGASALSITLAQGVTRIGKSFSDGAQLTYLCALPWYKQNKMLQIRVGIRILCRILDYKISSSGVLRDQQCRKEGLPMEIKTKDLAK